MLKTAICTIVTAAAITCLPGNLSAQPSRQEAGREQERSRDGNRGREAAQSLERIVDDLALSDDPREKTMKLIRDYQSKIRSLSDTAESNLMEKLRKRMNDADYQSLRTNLNQQLTANRDGQRPIQTAEVIERILAFDKDSDGLVTKSELPERMQPLVDRGDSNQDGSLDRQEIAALAKRDEPQTERTEPERRADPDRRTDPDRRSDREGQTGRQAGPQSRESTGFSFRQIEQALVPMKGTDAPLEVAGDLLKSARNEAAKDTERLRSELLTNLGQIVSSEAHATLKTALERGPAIGEQPRRGAERGREATDRR